MLGFKSIVEALQRYNFLEAQISYYRSQQTLTNIHQQSLENYELQLHEMNVNNRNNHNVQNTMAEFLDIEHTTYPEVQIQTIINSEVKHALLMAPTQVGKSGGIVSVINQCQYHNHNHNQKIAVIVSSDNKKDQQEQLYSRINSQLKTSLFKTFRITKNQDMKQFRDTIAQSSLIPVIFCLDNNNQIDKVGTYLPRIYAPFSKLVIIHDEGDTTTKCSETYTDTNLDSSKSHTSWVNLIQDASVHMLVKRIFVSATPENCMIKYNIQANHIIQLEKPMNYRGYDKIIHRMLPTTQEAINSEIQKLIIEEEERDDYNIILYSMDRRIDEQHIALDKFSQELTGSVIIHTHNSTGIKTTVPNAKFRQALLSHDPELTAEIGEYCTIKKDIPIRVFYQLAKDSGIHTALTIGKDMLSRGVSYCSERVEEKTMAATVMFYQSSDSTHCVSLIQSIGRITGMARAERTAYIYTDKKSYDDFVKHNKNQEDFCKKIQSNGGISSIFMEAYEAPHYTERPIDRKKLAISMNYTTTVQNEPVSDSTEIIDGVFIKKLERWCRDVSCETSRIIHYLFQHNGRVEREKLIQELRINISSLKNISGIRTQHGKVINNRGQIVTFNKKILPYIQQYIEVN
jgi:hypothetical protein